MLTPITGFPTRDKDDPGYRVWSKQTGPPPANGTFIAGDLWEHERDGSTVLLYFTDDKWREGIRAPITEETSKWKLFRLNVYEKEWVHKSNVNRMQLKEKRAREGGESVPPNKRGKRKIKLVKGLLLHTDAHICR